ncbi:MAG TPA: carboxypeptidase-like regulatory domain-containing protein [Chryseolinea sp.]|nr:carboxypeptidase-like regulatory domain-containing protein [Chryseolinea sp.]
MKHLNLTIPKPCADKWQDFKHTSFSNILPGLVLLKAGLACLILMFSTRESFGQTASVKQTIDAVEHRESNSLADPHATISHIVMGVVKDEARNPMPGVNIYLKGGTEGTVTDADGRFEFPRRLETGEILTFSYIGYESIEYMVQENGNDNIEIVMNIDVEIIGEVAVEKAYTSKTGFRQWLKDIF